MPEYLPCTTRTRRSVSPSGARCFTLAQANRSLVLIKRIVADVMPLHAEFIDWQEAYDLAAFAGPSDRAAAAARRVREVAAQLRQAVEDLQQVGAELRDWALGMVDFPCWTAGREVRLCWTYGEETISHWHEPHEGCTLRRSLAELLEEEVALSR